MGEDQRVSIQAQAGHVNWLCNVVDRLEPEATKRGLRSPKEAELRTRYSAAVVGTMKWLVENVDEIKLFLAHRQELRAFLSLPEAQRAAVLRNWHALAVSAVEMNVSGVQEAIAP
jgi:hypothetical protein